MSQLLQYIISTYTMICFNKSLATSQEATLYIVYILSNLMFLFHWRQLVNSCWNNKERSNTKTYHNTPTHQRKYEDKCKCRERWCGQINKASVWHVDKMVINLHPLLRISRKIWFFFIILVLLWLVGVKNGKNFLLLRNTWKIKRSII